MCDVGKRITTLRMAKGMSQKKLAAMTNITEASLSRYENGMREPKITTLMKLASTLNCTVDFLIGKTEIEDGVIVSKRHFNNELELDGDHIDLLLQMKKANIQPQSIKALLDVIQMEKSS